MFSQSYKYLISNEGLIGTDENYFLSGEVPFDEIEDLKAIGNKYPNAKILIGFREHSDYVFSRYKYYIKRGGTLPLKKFYDLEYDNGILKTKNLLYVNMIETILNNFANIPFVFLYEELVNQPLKLFSMMGDYFGVNMIDFGSIDFRRHNAGLGYNQSEILRFFNKTGKKDMFENKYFKKLKLTPYDILQKTNRFSSNKEHNNEYKNLIKEKFKNDWNDVQYCINEFRMNLGKTYK